MPVFCGLMGVALFSSLGLPGTNGFVGEFLILLGAFRTHPLHAALATLGIVVAAAYLLAFVGRIFHGPLRVDLQGLSDLRPRDYAVHAPLVALLFWVGLLPGPLLDRSEATVRALLRPTVTSAPPALTSAGFRDAPLRRSPGGPARDAARFVRGIRP